MALPYDSAEGRDMAGAITALMCGEAYAQSSRIAERMGAVPGLRSDREPMLDVIRMHRDAMRGIQPSMCRRIVLMAAQDRGTPRCAGEKHGYKNAQVPCWRRPARSVMMDCDTTGIEPDWRW